MAVALITGAGSGIGKATAMRLSLEGFAVVLSGRRSGPLTETANEIRAREGEALAVQCDVSDSDSVDSLFRRIRATYGRLDLLFNNAGYRPAYTPLGDCDEVEWDRTIATNLTGAFLCTRAAMKLMQEQRPQGGRIINNGSLSAHRPRPHSAAYTTTKHGMSGLTKATALDGRESNIASGQIDIGNAKTTMIEADIHRDLKAGEAAEPFIDVNHVARAVALMASLPLDANIPTIMIMPTRLPFVGRG